MLVVNVLSPVLINSTGNSSVANIYVHRLTLCCAFRTYYCRWEHAFKVHRIYYKILSSLDRYIRINLGQKNERITSITRSTYNKKHLKNVGPIRHNEPPHANSPDVASGTVARRLRIDVYDNDDNDNA